MRTSSLVRVCSLAGAALLVTGLCAAQQMADEPRYMELSWMRVKQDKTAEFAQMSARIADANRRGKGDTWVAYADLYGRDNFVWMAAGRKSLGDIEPGMNKFMGAIKEFMGYSGERFFAEASKTVENSGSELWRHRFDLSWNLKDGEDWEAHLAKAHYVAVVTIRVKPGHVLDTEQQIKMVSEAVTGSSDSKAVGLVSELVMGGEAGRFYVRIPFESLADFGQMPSVRRLLGDEGYRKYSEMTAQDFASVDYSLKRIVPEWSSPPAGFVEANPAMWKMKPMVTAKPKPAAAPAKPAASGD